MAKKQTKSVTCPKCGKEFKNAAGLTGHMRWAHGIHNKVTKPDEISKTLKAITDDLQQKAESQEKLNQGLLSIENELKRLGKSLQETVEERFEALKQDKKRVPELGEHLEEESMDDTEAKKIVSSLQDDGLDILRSNKELRSKIKALRQDIDRGFNSILELVQQPEKEKPRKRF